jgi:tetraacyldisaccharide 4'-kinase
MRSGKAQSIPVFSIAIGNLAAGGSGKTPMTIFIAQRINQGVAVLSRGYKRKTEGFREVEIEDSVENCGDEPLEMKNALAEVPVFVCENRLSGIAQIQQNYPEIKTVILDDAFQHLPLKAHKYVLLTDYKKPFWQDLPMPAGRLREFTCTAFQADVIVVTKCPADLSEQTAVEINQRLKKYGKPVFFCCYENAVPVNSGGEALNHESSVVAVSGLADNRAFQSWANKHYPMVGSFSYPDHHYFAETHYQKWSEEISKNEKAVILTTRKDFARMAHLPEKLKKRIFMTFTTPKFLFQQEDAFIRTLFNHF